MSSFAWAASLRVFQWFRLNLGKKWDDDFESLLTTHEVSSSFVVAGTVAKNGLSLKSNYQIKLCLSESLKHSVECSFFLRNWLSFCEWCWTYCRHGHFDANANLPKFWHDHMFQQVDFHKNSSWNSLDSFLELRGWEWRSWQ